MEYDQYYQKLNPEQKNAVDSIEGPVLVLAGPGTGKTQTIAIRIGKILRETQVDPHNILCLTFTETAVVAMRKRLAQIIGATAYSVRIHTFHSFCNEVIQSHPERFSELGRDASSLTSVEKIQLLKQVLSELDTESPLVPFGDPETYLYEISSKISSLKKEGLDANDLQTEIEIQKTFFEESESTFEKLFDLHASKLTDDSFYQLLSDLEQQNTEYIFVEVLESLVKNALKEELDEKEIKKARTKLRTQIKDLYKKNNNEKLFEKLNELVEVFKKYQLLLRERNRYDFEDMIMFVVKKFKEDNELLQLYQEQFQYILVDEYQDTNTAQNETVKLLGSFFESPNIFVVGDDEQSIYRFQGASLENITFFHDLYKDSIQVVTLKKNYRSHQNILDVARKLIENNTSDISEYVKGISKAQDSEARIDSGSVELYSFTSNEEENFYIASSVRKLIDQGVDPNEISILYRENKDGNDIAQYLEAQGIKYNLTKGVNIFHDTLIQQLFKLFKYIAEPIDDQQLFHILNFEFLGFDNLDLIKIYRASYKNRIDLGDLLLDSKALGESGINGSEKLVEFMSKYQTWQKESHNISFIIFFNKVIRESGFLDHILNHDDKYLLLLKLNRLYEEVKQLEYANRDYTLKQFIQHLDLIDEYNLELKVKADTEDTSAVQLMTAHGSKGLEFEYVFLTKAISKRWGGKQNREKIKLPLGITAKALLEDSTEEERRLFYVALTRAKRHAYITYSEQNAEQVEQEKSLFVVDVEPFVNKQEKVTNTEEEKLNALSTVFKNQGQFKLATDSKEFLTNLLADYKLSVTHLTSYKNCPRCFFYNTLLRVPKLKGKSASFGTAVHNALRDLVVLYNKTKELPGEDYLLQQFEKHLLGEKLEHEDLESSLEHGKLALARYYTERKYELSIGSEVEYDFNYHNVIVEGVPLVGKIDRVDFLDQKKKNAVVVDYKTGNPDSKSGELRKSGKYGIGDYVKQLTFYKLLGDNSSRAEWETHKGRIEFIVPSKKNNNEIIIKEFELTDEYISDLVEEIKNTYQSIKNLEFERCNEKDCYTPEFHSIDFK